MANKYKLKKFPLKKKLPTTLSGWIDESLDDVQKLRKTPGFSINMHVFNEIDDADTYYNDRLNRYAKNSGFEKCAVCMGGAAIVGCGLVEPGEELGNREAKSVAFAIDSVRRGDIFGALEELGFGIPTGDKYFKIEVLEQLISNKYNETRGMAPMRVYRKVARDLKKLGL